MKINIDNYNDLELALMAMLDFFGTGATRKKKLGSRYAKVQAYINQIVSGTMPKSPTPSGEGYPVNKIVLGLRAIRPTEEDYEDFIQDVINAIKEV